MEHPVEQQPPIDDAREMDVDPSAPGTSQQTPPIVSQKRPREVDTSHPEQDPKRPCRVETGGTHSIVQDTQVHVPDTHFADTSPMPPAETSGPTSTRPTLVHVPSAQISEPIPPLVETNGSTSPMPAPVHVPPTQISEPITPVQVFRSISFEPIPLQFRTSTPSSSQLTPSSPTRPFVHFGFGSASIPTQLRDIFDIDTNEDKLKDAEGRGGPDKRGDMTRPLKNRKIRWLYRHWWSEEGEYIWYDHGASKNVTYRLTKDQVLTLRPGGQLEDDVVNAYCELLKIREEKLWNSNKFEAGKALRFFFAPSYFMVWAGYHCPPDLKVPPNEKTGTTKAEMEDFFRQYSNQRVGQNIQFCDIAFFPTCSRGHWFLFIVNLRHHKVMIIDPLRDESLYSGDKMYPQEYYIMEKFIPHMLNYLHSARFQLRYMKVKAFEDRPKQEGGINYGVYV